MTVHSLPLIVHRPIVHFEQGLWKAGRRDGYLAPQDMFPPPTKYWGNHTTRKPPGSLLSQAKTVPQAIRWVQSPPAKNNYQYCSDYNKTGMTHMKHCDIVSSLYCNLKITVIYS